MTFRTFFPAAALAGVSLLLLLGAGELGAAPPTSLNSQLRSRLAELDYSGRAGDRLEARLGRKVDRKLADLGRLLWFDTLTGLNDDNSCGGCHSPTTGFGDTQSIAIGIENNALVGPNRTGPRNQRRTPLAINTAFYPALMWNSRFSAPSGDPFDNSGGFQFPAPEGTTLSHLPHLLTAQAFIPPTERNEVAGFHFVGNSDDIRAEVLNRLNNSAEYRKLFGKRFPAVKQGGPITFDMFGHAIAEFEFTLTFCDAPIDRFAKGNNAAMTTDEKQGALLFFGKAGCVSCHTVSGAADEMFSDFQNRVAGVPQVAPAVTNSVFDGPGANEDFGLEQVTGNPDDRYRFRTSPLRNVGLQPAFFHNGAFTTLESAIRFHLDASTQALSYSPAHPDADLTGPTGPMEPVLARLDPLLAAPVKLTDQEFSQLVAFVRDGLTDKRARVGKLRKLIPPKSGSGRPLATYE